LISSHGDFNARLPANGIIVFQRISTSFVGGFLTRIALDVAGWARRFVEIMRAR
jgi:hypothetical protein